MMERKVKFKVSDPDAVEGIKAIKKPSLKSIIHHKSKRSGEYFVIEIIDNSWN